MYRRVHPGVPGLEGRSEHQERGRDRCDGGTTRDAGRAAVHPQRQRARVHRPHAAEVAWPGRRRVSSLPSGRMITTTIDLTAPWGASPQPCSLPAAPLPLGRDLRLRLALSSAPTVQRSQPNRNLHSG